MCKAWLHRQDLVEKHMGKALAARPYWLALLELYIAETEQRAMFSACFMTGETPSNVHRRLVRLVHLGAVTRRPDANDHRRVDLRLTPAIRASIEKVLDDVIAAEITGGAVTVGVAGSESGAPQGATDRLLGQRYRTVRKAIVEERGLEDGRIAVPPEWLKSFNLKAGDAVLVDVDKLGLKIRAVHP